MSQTLVSAWKSARERLTAAGIDSPVIDARLLLEAAAEASRLEIVTEPQRTLSLAQEERLESFLQRREAREPVSHILGRKGFWKIMLKVTGDVLTPRPDTETLLDVVLPALPEAAQAEILDLGVGSGAVLLAILAERPRASGLGVDISEAALEVARENAALLDLSDRALFSHASWTAGLADDRFDIVVSNPPYIPTGDITGLDPEVRDHEPHVALDGGADGLDAYRILAPEILRVLKPGGLFAVEIGPAQTEAVSGLFTAAGAVGVRMQRDLATRERVITGMKKALGNTVLNG
ncbi:MAG: peptide chain release factor N(5)-glutamine methyltransferase [Caulobacteraceae bacterium]